MLCAILLKGPSMDKSKPNQFRPPTAHGLRQRLSDAGSGRTEAGWEAYRKWLAGADSTRVRRQQADISLYSWKGYQNWADKIRRSWDDDK